jgi:hypothetical protein
VNKSGIFRRSVVVLLTLLFCLLLAYISLLLTSHPLNSDQRQMVDRSIEVIRESGLDSEARLLRSVVSYRSTDNWWNRFIGHRDAYASTNFPFQVMTLYREFFETTEDDIERASILLHEYFHLLGKGEEEALAETWKKKSLIGWNEDEYGESVVWRNVKELTETNVPSLFECGAGGDEDCYP